MKAELKAHYKDFLTGLTTETTQTGIDVLESTQFADLKTLAAAHGGRLKLGLLANQSSLDSQGHRTIDILAHAPPEIELKTLFAPEHGLFARQDTDHLTAEADTATHLPVISLYGPKPSDKHPKLADLQQLDAVVIDLQDAGTRFWTYETLTGYFLQACAEAHIDLIVLDRPNPLGGIAVQGEVSAPGQENYNNFMPIPLRHGLTLGELAGYFNANLKLVAEDPGTHEFSSIRALEGPGYAATHCRLTVIKMTHWTRSELWSDTQLPWIPPSPNLKSPTASILYPGVGLTDQTNISVGRGTNGPFENIGASWIDAQQLATYLTQRNISGVSITPTTLTIADDANHYPFHGQTIPAIHFTVTDPQALDSPELGIELLSALHRLYPTQFKLDLAKTLIANAAILAALKAGEDPHEIAATWLPALRSFEQARKPYLLYQ